MPIARDVSLRVDEGEIVGLIGESGSGKTMTAKSLIGLLPERIRVVAGRGDVPGAGPLRPRRAADAGSAGRRDSPHPAGRPACPQPGAGGRAAGGRAGRGARAPPRGRDPGARGAPARTRAHSEPPRAKRRLPAPVLGRNAAARAHRDGAVDGAAPHPRRRAHHRPRRDHTGRDHRPHPGLAGADRHQLSLHLARPRPGLQPLRSDLRHVRGRDRRERRARRDLRPAAPPLHARPDGRRSPACWTIPSGCRPFPGASRRRRRRSPAAASGCAAPSRKRAARSPRRCGRPPRGTTPAAGWPEGCW